MRRFAGPLEPAFGDQHTSAAAARPVEVIRAHQVRASARDEQRFKPEDSPLESAHAPVARASSSSSSIETSSSAASTASNSAPFAHALLEARAEFGGEDVAHPYLREELEFAQAELDGVHRDAEALLGEFALPEDDALRLERLRSAVARYRAPR